MADQASPSDAPAPAVPTSTPAEAAAPKGPGDLVLKVLGAIATGIGVLGVVAFFGGAILWVRLNEAKLPATEAVAVIPHSVLVTTGAVFLAPAAGVAAGVILASFLVYLISHAGIQSGARKRRRKARKTRQVAEAAGRDANAQGLAAKNARAKLAALEKGLADAKKAGEAERVRNLEADIAQKGPAADHLEAMAERLVSAAVAAKANAYNEMEEAEFELERSPRQLAGEAALGGLVLILLPLLSNQVIGHAGFWWGLALGAVLVIGAAISAFAYIETEKFIWFGIAAFATVGVYLVLATYVSTERNPKMQPASALRTGHDPLYGAFIADTASNLYLATFGRTGKPPHLLVIPRAQITELAVGPLLSPDEARDRAISMALEECEQKVEVPATETTKAKKIRACESDQKQALRDARVK